MAHRTGLATMVKVYAAHSTQLASNEQQDVVQIPPGVSKERRDVSASLLTLGPLLDLPVTLGKVDGSTVSTSTIPSLD